MPAWAPAQISPSLSQLCLNFLTTPDTHIGKLSNTFSDTYLAQRTCNLHLEEESTDWKDILMQTEPRRNTGAPYLATHSSLMEELSPGAHASKNSLHYQPLKPNTSPLLMPPKKPSGSAISLEKFSHHSQNPQHFIVTINQPSPSPLTEITMLAQNTLTYATTSSDLSLTMDCLNSFIVLPTT